MQIDRKKELIRVGSLVMWNRDHSEDFGSMGIVIEHEFYGNTKDGDPSIFFVLWSDNDRCEYDYGDLWRGHIKVVKK